MKIILKAFHVHIQKKKIHIHSIFYALNELRFMYNEHNAGYSRYLKKQTNINYYLLT